MGNASWMHEKIFLGIVLQALETLKLQKRGLG
jgi:hypothetical protein